jgi:MFS superfamily sulfate permease-like transporter
VGVVTKYLSDVIVAAFTTGAAYHIVVSQIPILLGIKTKIVDIPTKIIGVKFFYILSKYLIKSVIKFQSKYKDLIDIFSIIDHTNIATLVISIISMIFIYCVKHFINEKFKHKMPVPIPVDLIVVY